MRVSYRIKFLRGGNGETVSLYVSKEEKPKEAPSKDPNFLGNAQTIMDAEPHFAPDCYLVVLRVHRALPCSLDTLRLWILEASKEKL